MLLAVYGTLKKGYWNHDRHLGNAAYQGGTWIRDFALADEGQYPFAFRFPGQKLWAEVYAVDADTLAKCDRLEGVSSVEGQGYYSREEVDTFFGKTYMYAQTNRVLVATDKWFPSGVWLSARSPSVPWLGYATEIKLAQEAEQVRLRRAEFEANESRIYVPSQMKCSGEMVKIWDPKTSEFQYVPKSECVYDENYNSWSLKDAVKHALASSPIREAIVPVPEVPSKRQEARDMIKKAVEEHPGIPEERVA